MNLGFSLNIANIFRSSAAPTQAQVNQQVSSGAGSAFARDSVSRKGQKRKALNAIGARVGTKKVLDRAGVTKVAAAKKR